MAICVRNRFAEYTESREYMVVNEAELQKKDRLAALMIFHEWSNVHFFTTGIVAFVTIWLLSFFQYTPECTCKRDFLLF